MQYSHLKFINMFINYMDTKHAHVYIIYNHMFYKTESIKMSIHTQVYEIHLAHIFVN